MQLNPYLNFNGQCEQAFKFYERCLNGKIQGMMKHSEMPSEYPVRPEWRDKILHASMAVGDQLLMGTDAPPDHYQKPQGISVALHYSEVAEAERVFAGLSDKGKVTMPMQETFWALRFGMLVDQFGIPWMVNCSKPS
jgi:PhnB protein